MQSLHLEFQEKSYTSANFDIPPRLIASACLATNSPYPSALFPSLSSFVIYIGIRTREDSRQKTCMSTTPLQQSHIAESISDLTS